MQENIDEVEIDFLEIFLSIKKNIIVLILFAVLGGFLGFIYSNFFIVPQYQSSGTMIVNSKQEATGTLTSSDITSSSQLISTYGLIIKSDRVLNEVINNLGLNIHYTELAKKISIVSVNSTQVMSISVEDNDPVLARNIVFEIMSVSPDIIIDVVEAGSVKTISEPEIPVSPISPNITKNTVLVAIIFFVLSGAIVVLRTLLDTRIKSEKTLEDIFDIPVIGIIPTIESSLKNAKGGYYDTKKKHDS